MKESSSGNTAAPIDDVHSSKECAFNHESRPKHPAFTRPRAFARRGTVERDTHVNRAIDHEVPPMDGYDRSELDSVRTGPQWPEPRLPRTSEQLVVRRELDSEALTLHVAGVIDTITAPRLAVDLEVALGSGASLLIVDLTGVEFLAAAGINLLVDVQRLTEGHTTEMRVVARGPVTGRPLEVLGLDAYLDVYSSVASARR